MSIQRVNVDNSADRWPSDDGLFVFYSDHLAEMDKLRESVRRLVGEWRKLSMDDQMPNNFLKGVDKCADELSALIDGKEQL
jgi:hypothetical protein